MEVAVDRRRRAAAEAQRVADQPPQHRRDAHRDEALDHDRERVLSPDQPAVEEGEARRHQHHQARGKKHEPGVAPLIISPPSSDDIDDRVVGTIASRTQKIKPSRQTIVSLTSQNQMTRAFVGVPRAPPLGLGAVSASAGDNVRLSRAALVPLALDQPWASTSRQTGPLLVVEWEPPPRPSRPVDRARHTARDLRQAVGVARAPSGSIFVSDGGKLRVDPAARGDRRLRRRQSEIGPVAVTSGGDVVYAMATRSTGCPAGRPARHGPSCRTVPSSTHGIAVARNGSPLVSDTDNNRILRVDGNHVTTFPQTGHPRGIDVARDGTVYVAAADRHRIARYSASGTRLGLVGPRFDRPYRCRSRRMAPSSALDLGVIGTVRRIAPDGTASVVAAP